MNQRPLRRIHHGTENPNSLFLNQRDLENPHPLVRLLPCLFLPQRYRTCLRGQESHGMASQVDQGRRQQSDERISDKETSRLRRGGDVGSTSPGAEGPNNSKELKGVQLLSTAVPLPLSVPRAHQLHKEAGGLNGFELRNGGAVDLGRLRGGGQEDKRLVSRSSRSAPCPLNTPVCHQPRHQSLPSHALCH